MEGKQLPCPGGISSADQAVKRKIAPTTSVGVNKLSGTETVFAQLLDEGRAPDLQKARSFGHRAVGFLERLPNEADLDRRQMVLEVDAAARQCALNGVDGVQAFGR